MDKNKILDYHLVKKKIIRISLQIIESNSIDDEIIIAGIENNGYLIAKKICNEIKKISDKKIQLCSIKIDKKNPRKEITVSLVEEQYENKSVVIVDDVLNSGSTLMYAVKYFLDTKLKKLKTAVLVDRNHKKYPIKADYKGLSLSTSIQNHVEVSINDNEINAYLV
ncbi:MAG: phosphoribosyltransferase [Flavobacteriaceae bacterium]|nr:phosphoribosyltransferase [Flavobacteriaceae bacterium]|tara:strand:- start:904 stop:1401 length:498 start_codon:yes stop_codon:yes gene_type:complete